MDPYYTIFKDIMEHTDNKDDFIANGLSGRNKQALRRLTLAEMSLVGSFIILLGFVCNYASVILIPLTFATLLSLLLTPVIHFLSWLHIPKRIGAAMIVASIVGIFAGGIIVLSSPAEEWLAQSPQILQKMEKKLKKIKKPLEQVQKAAEKVSGMTQVEHNPRQLVVKTKSEKLIDTIFTATPEVLIFLVLSMALLYFLLFSSKTLVEFLINGIYWLAHQDDTTNMGHRIQREISRYLLTITIINGSLGLVVTLVFTLIGMPNPILWGTMAALLNFLPYIGALCSAVIITLVSFVTFDTLPHIILPPVVFLLITTLEGQFITPQILGDRFSMNPLLIFLSIVFWGWLWGYIGALLAFPLLVSVKVICQSIDVLQPFADFLHETGNKEAVDSR